MDHKGFFTTVLGIDDPEIVAVMNAAAHEEHYPRGHCLISMGEVRPSIHLLLEGVLRAYVVDENGRDVTDCFIYQTGDVVVGCGEYAEIWSAEEYDRIIGGEDADELRDALEALGL